MKIIARQTANASWKLQQKKENEFSMKKKKEKEMVNGNCWTRITVCECAIAYYLFSFFIVCAFDSTQKCKKKTTKRISEAKKQTLHDTHEDK